MSIIKKLFKKPEPPKPQHIAEETLDHEPVCDIDMNAFQHNVAKEFHKQYSIDQMNGFHMIITKYYEMGFKNTRWLAYILATAWHETGFKMTPVTEYGSPKYLQAKPYWPYIGRGFVQITHRENYEKYKIADNPDMALDPEMATFILIDGMVRGTFSGRNLRHYFNTETNDPYNARKIVNVLDRAARVQEYHEKFLRVLDKSLFEV